MPFHLRPSGMAIYMRQKVGKACLLQLARTPFTPINIKDVVKPVGAFLASWVLDSGEGGEEKVVIH